MLKWNKPETAPTDGTIFIYTDSFKVKGIVSQCSWRDADEDQEEGFYDFDVGQPAEIAGWIPKPEAPE